MTPTTLPKSSTLTPASINTPIELATQPLAFSAQRQCKNPAVLVAIFDALNDKSRADQHIALIFSNAFRHHYLPELNNLIASITTQHGVDSVTISPRVVQLLADEGIELIRNNDGTVHMSRPTATCWYSNRHDEINDCATRFLCDDVAKLLCDFDDEIEISDKNRKEITSIFRSGDATAKSLIIAAASHQNNIIRLNGLFNEFRSKNWTLDLSFIDLSNLNLTGIELVEANLKGTNLENSCLKKAQLQRANLTCANLNGANLEKAALDDADLSHARLIAAHLGMTKLGGTLFNGTLLLCATLSTSDKIKLLPNSIYQFAQIKTPFSPSMVPLPHLNTVLNIVVSDDPDQATLPGAIRQNPVIITTAEKNRLLENGLTFDDNRDGTSRVRKPLLLHKNIDRDSLIDQTLEDVLPSTLTKIISDYDDEIDICPANEDLLLDILKSDDQLAKGQIIAAASHRSQIGELNALFRKLRKEKVTLDLSRVDLCNLSLHGINLNDANLTGAKMHGCDLYQATLHRARLVGANLNGASLESAELNNANLSDARLLGANLFRAILIGARLAGAILKFANLTKADLQGDTNLKGAYLDYANLEGASLGYANLTNASLLHVKMYHTQLDRANLTNARLMHAELFHTSLMTTNMTGADFSDSTLDQVTLMMNPILTGTIWTGASFHQIHADEATKKKLPLRMWMHCKWT